MRPTFIFLPLSNEKYTYILLLDTGEIIERDNKQDDEITRFKGYTSFKEYYLKLNQRVCLPDDIEGFFSSYLLAKNYLNDQDKIQNIGDYIDDYLSILEENLSFKIDKNRLSEKEYILRVLNELREEISYNGLQKYEIPIIVLYGEYIRALFPYKKWDVEYDYNILGKKYYYPTLTDENITDYTQRVLYDKGDDKIFNFQYLLDLADTI